MVIQGWMINELKLKSNELLVYALIYGFSQDGHSEFKGTKNYLAKAIGGCTNTVRTVIKTLMSRSLVTERTVEVGGIYFKRYKAIKNCMGGAEIAPNNTNYNIKDNIDCDSENLIEVKENILMSEFDFKACTLKPNHPHRYLLESGCRLFSFFKQNTQNKDLDSYSLKEWLIPLKALSKNYKREQIEELVEYANADKFWGAIVLNTESLQKNFEKIKAQLIKSANEKQG